MFYVSFERTELEGSLHPMIRGLQRSGLFAGLVHRALKMVERHEKKIRNGMEWAPWRFCVPRQVEVKWRPWDELMPRVVEGMFAHLKDEQGIGYVGYYIPASILEDIASD